VGTGASVAVSHDFFKLRFVASSFMFGAKLLDPLSVDLGVADKNECPPLFSPSILLVVDDKLSNT
jgi:hypothetical protein